MDSTTIKRPAALSKGAADAIRKAIIQGEFGLGEALPEAQLTRRLGISKTPIREGLTLLSKEGLVTSFPQRGFFVFTLTRECVTQLCDFRHAMETIALDMALRHNRERLIADLEGICAEMRAVHEKGDFKRYLELDTAFHAAFFEGAENPYVKASYQMAASKVATIRTHLSRGHLRTDLSLAEHTGILHALKDGEDRKARAVLKKQIFRGEQVYEELITEPNGKAG
ncbi:GntR family transcriptional regulator [Labrenzia sp. DG1229]|uniref:GntR family transcriptional regulator n=1 Tax=Labrenzia sp. DG1229 TaxID=681847 RepID=UPI000567951C|nr:GntR family transcriptional regulator [Labrenzia sp. DG1229]